MLPLEIAWNVAQSTGKHRIASEILHDRNYKFFYHVTVRHIAIVIRQIIRTYAMISSVLYIYIYKIFDYEMSINLKGDSLKRNKAKIKNKKNLYFSFFIY